MVPAQVFGCCRQSSRLVGGWPLYGQKVWDLVITHSYILVVAVWCQHLISAIGLFFRRV